MRVSVVIPNYNGEKLLKDSLPRVISVSDRAEIIVVDDASTDASIETLKREFPQIKLITHRQNLGFSSTVNDGVKNASGSLIYLLNSDVVPSKNYLSLLKNYFLDPEVFAVGSLQKTVEENKTTLRGRGIGKFTKGFLIHQKGEINKKDTLWVGGGAGMFRKSLWEKFGGMNTIYNPFYWEDIDLSYRALKAGYKIYFEERSIVTHSQHKGAIRSSYSPVLIKTIAYRNQFFFIWVNITDNFFLIEHFFWLPYYLIRAIITFDFAFLRGFYLAVLQLRKVLEIHCQNQKRAKISDREVIKKFL